MVLARDYWARFERFTQQLQKSCKSVFIVTGPLFLPQMTPNGLEMKHPVIGDPYTRSAFSIP